MRLISLEKHPKILEMKEVYEGENSIYLIVELARGKTLNQFLKSKQYQLSH